MKSCTWNVKLLNHFLHSLIRWCTVIKSKMLFQLLWVPSTVKIQLLLNPHLTRSVSSILKNLNRSAYLVVMTWLHSFKIFLSIYQLVNTLDHSLTQSSHSRNQRVLLKVVKVLLKELQLRILLKWSMTTHLMISKCFWKRFGSFNSTDGLWKNAMVVLKLRWMNFLRLKVIGKLFKLSTTPSWDKTWQVLQDTV